MGNSHLDAVVQAAVQSGEIVGAVVLVSHQGKIVQHLAAGMADREHAVPMDEAIGFRIASMTKAIVSVTALALCDQGVLRLDDPVTRWLPDFTPALPDGSRPVITLRHLLTHSAGLGYTITEATDGPLHHLGVSDGLDESRVTLAENVARVAQAPLLTAPGTVWAYSIAVDVVGAVMEAATGTALPPLVRDLVTAPLGLTRTGFLAEPDTRLATPYAPGKAGIIRMGDPEIVPIFDAHVRFSPSRIFDPNAWPSGGTGMMSTAAEYLVFLEAIRRGGAPLLKPETAQLFRTNAIGDIPLPGRPGQGFGLGVSVITDPAICDQPGSAGSWAWGGVYGGNYFVDPTAELSVVCLTNTALLGMTGTFPLALRRAVYRDL